jgi:hypothetical protein
MKHQYWLKKLSAYLDDEISVSKRRKIELHLGECEICRSNLTLWKKIHNVRKEEPILTPDPELWQSIYYRLRSEQLQPLHVWEDERLINRLPNPVPALVSVMVVLFLVFAAQPYLTSRIESFPTIEKTDISIDRYLISDTELSSTNGLDILIPANDESRTTEGAI